MVVKVVKALRAFVVSLLNSTFRTRRFTTFVVETTSAAKTDLADRGMGHCHRPWPQTALLLAVLQGGRSFIF